MAPLALQPGAAHTLLVAVIAIWVAAEVLLRVRNIGSRSALDWTLPLVVAAVAAGTTLGFRVAHAKWAIVGGGWTAVTVGLIVSVAGSGLRIWAILTLGRFFKFVVVIQDGHRVIERGPYRFLRHPSYTGALVAFLGLGIALDNWLSAATMVLIPLGAVLVRIRVEERRLCSALGQEYGDYAARTRRLIPGVW